MASPALRPYSRDQVKEACNRGEKLIIVDGCVFNVAELQDGEHKGGAVFDYGADMTGIVAALHGNVPKAPSTHEDGKTVMENLQEKFSKFCIGVLEGRAAQGPLPTDAVHRWWVPAKPKTDYAGKVATSLEAQGEDTAALLRDALHGLPPVEQRAMCAVLCALAGDAAAVPTHWNYDVGGKDGGAFQQRLRQEFVSPSHNAFYRTPLGSQSCYGDQLHLMLKSIVAHSGAIDEHDMRRRVAAVFRPEGEYGYGPMDPGEVTRDTFLISTPWRNGSISSFLKNAAARSFDSNGGMLECMMVATNADILVMAITNMP